MSKDFKTPGRPQQPKRSAAGRKQQALPRARRQRSADAPNAKAPYRASKFREKNFDTVPTEPLNWWWPLLLGGSIGTIAMLLVGTRVFSPEQQAVVTAPNVPASTAPATVSEGELFLEQANLLAVNGDLIGAVEIASSIPTGSEAYATAQQRIKGWQGAISGAQEEAKTASLQELEQARARAAEAQRAQERAQEKARVAEVRRQQEVAAAQRDREAAQARAEAAEAQAAEVQQPEPPLATGNPQPIIELKPRPTPQPQPATEPEPPLVTANPQPTIELEPRPTPQPEVATEQPQPQPLVNSADTPAPQPSASSPTADPFLSNSIADKIAPPTPVAPVELAAVPTLTVPTVEDSYGFRNVTVKAPRVAISLRDNVDEDGDFVTLRVNGKDYATNQLISHSPEVILVPLNLGENLVEIVAVKDGQGGITLEADVAGAGNINDRPIPEGRTARFIINYEE